jgi:hypothetical protein
MYNRNIYSGWYGSYKTKPKIKDSMPYKVRFIKEDNGQPFPGIGEKTINSFSPSQARFLFLRKYPHLNDYLEMGYKVEVEMDAEKYRQRKETEELEKQKKEEKIQGTWYYKDNY